ncbi:MAG: RDD family protein [Candidatus Gastranaerophilales bacterium]|nr:RDD family protein [Candidatus Gastranaerophilales bacterium]
MDDFISLPIRNVRTLAQLNERSLAFLIDLLVFFFLILMPFSSIYYEMSGINPQEISVSESMDNPRIFGILMVGYFACLLIFLFYLSAFEYMIGATIGKRMIGLSLAHKDKKMSLWKAILRNLAKSVLFNFLVFDCFLMLFDPQKRRISDFLAGTIVVSSRKIIKKFKAVNEI